MYERDLFFITKTLSLEAVVKEECELSPWNNWPLSPGAEDSGKGREKEGEREAQHY